LPLGATSAVDPPAIGITPTTLSLGVEQAKMAFIPGEGPDAWIQSSQGRPPSSSVAMSAPSDPKTIGSLVTGVQLDLAKELLGGIAGPTPQQASDSTGLPKPEPAPPGSPTPSIDESQPAVPGVFKPNGS